MCCRTHFLAIALLALVGLAGAIDVPLIMWSSGRHLSAKGATSESNLDYTSLPHVLLQAAQLEPQSSQDFGLFASGRAKPEIIILYLKSALRSDHPGRYTSIFDDLSTRFSNADTSVCVPFVYVPDSRAMQDALQESVTKITQQIDGRTLLLGDASLYGHLQSHCNAASQCPKQVQTLSDVVDLLSNSDTLSNGKLDLLVISDQTADQEPLRSYFLNVSIIEDTLTRLGCQSSVSILTSSTAPKPRNWQLLDDETSDYSWRYYFPVWFWEAGSYLLFFIIVAYFGSKCLMLIQTPRLFMSPAAVKQKME